MLSKLDNLPDSRRFQLLIDSVVDYAIYMIGLDGRVLSWNSGAAKLKGYTAAEITGAHFSKFYTPEDIANGLPERALRIAGEAGRYASEGWRVRKDGGRFWALVVLDAIRDDTGELLGFAKVTRDITERQRASEALLESERRYRRLIEAVVDYAIFQLDPQGRVTTWNTGAQRIKGYLESEIVGEHFSRFYTDEDRAAGVPARALAKAAETGRFEAEGYRVRKDGTTFWASVVIDAIKDPDGRIVGFAKVTRDITEKKQAEKELRETQEKLLVSQKLEAVGQLSGGIAHDFNNLLMIVLGNLETIQRQALAGAIPPSIQRATENAIRGARRASALTSRLLAFSRRQTLDPKPLDVNKFLAGTAEFLQRTLGERIEVAAVESAGAWRIEADPNHLESALVNLGINARDAMPDGGMLTISSTNVDIADSRNRLGPDVKPGQYVVISVADTGEGMTPETLNKAFEPFFTTKEVGRGTGLGLSQVYGFVKQSGGHVNISSERGVGTTVSIYLPRYLGADDVEAAQEDESYPHSAEAETILIVEDDPDLRAYVADILRSLDYRVHAAPRAEAALELLHGEGRIDLLLTDIVMPGMDGRALGRKARELRPGLRILYMTGYSRNAVVHEGRLEPGVDLIQKPVSQAQLAHRIRLNLDRRK